MTLSIQQVCFDEAHLIVEFSDKRILSVPLSWFPRLQQAAPAQRQCYELSPAGIHWDALDEDISVEGLLKGDGDRSIHPWRVA